MSPSPCALKGLSDFAARNPGPGRCSDEHFLVKPFSRVLVRGISPRPCACCASAPSQPQSLLIRGVSPNPCGAQVAFRLCWCKVPRPRRSADADFLVKPFGGVLVPGISPCPCACCASAPSQPQSAAADSPFQGQAGSGGAFAGRLRCFDVCDISLPLRRAACAAPPGVAFRLCRSRRNSNYSHASALCCGGAIRQTRPSPAKRAFARTKGRYSLPDMGTATTHERWRITSWYRAN